MSLVAMAAYPSRSTTRQVKIWWTTGARRGSGISRVLVAPTARRAGTGWGSFFAR
ncbi:MAG: hypothetical protein ACRDJ4_12000 [Actinomycetota bacterium]